MEYLIAHTRLFWCGWDLPALIILALVAAVCIYRVHKQKKTLKEFRSRIEEIRKTAALPLQGSEL